MPCFQWVRSTLGRVFNWNTIPLQSVYKLFTFERESRRPELVLVLQFWPVLWNASLFLSAQWSSYSSPLAVEMIVHHHQQRHAPTMNRSRICNACPRLLNRFAAMNNRLRTKVTAPIAKQLQHRRQEAILCLRRLCRPRRRHKCLHKFRDARRRHSLWRATKQLPTLNCNTRRRTQLARPVPPKPGSNSKVLRLSPASVLKTELRQPSNIRIRPKLSARRPMRIKVLRLQLLRR